MCAGYGGIGLGLKKIFGERMRTIAYCELEGFAQANLVSKMEKGLMDVAPLWNDLKTFPYKSFHGLVDILIAGYPCQPFSAAGKRAGKEDPRHLWPWIADGIRLLQPRMCFFENVEGHISLGLREVVGELEQIGYQTAFGIFSAREVGAVHQRKRVFIMANRINDGWTEEWKRGQCGILVSKRGSEEITGNQQAVSSKHSGKGCGELADDTGERLSLSYGQRNEPEGQRAAEFECCGQNAWPSRPGEPQHKWEPPRVVANSVIFGRGRGSDGEEEVLGNSTTEGLQGCGTVIEVDRESRGTESEGGELAPAPAISSDAHGGEVMANAESKQGTPRDHRGQQGSSSQQEQSKSGGGDCGTLRESNGEIKQSMGDPVDGTTDGVDISELSGLNHSELAEICEWMVKTDNRTDELRLLGNGVVPATAERAFRTLLTELITK